MQQGNVGTCSSVTWGGNCCPQMCHWPAAWRNTPVPTGCGCPPSTSGSPWGVRNSLLITLARSKSWDKYIITYKLDLPHHCCLAPSFHISQLGHRIAFQHFSWSPGHWRKPAYAVHQLFKSWHRLGQLQYLVDWEGYGPEAWSWVLARDIIDPFLTWDFLLGIAGHRGCQQLAVGVSSLEELIHSFTGRKAI